MLFDSTIMYANAKMCKYVCLEARGSRDILYEDTNGYHKHVLFVTISSSTL